LKQIRELGNLYEEGASLQTPNEISCSITGRRNLYNHLESMLKNAKNSVEIMTSVDRFKNKARKFKGVFDNLVKKRVKVRVAVSSGADLKNLFGINKSIEVKKSSFDIRLCLVDGKEVLFMLFDNKKIHPSYDVGIWVVNENLAGEMVKVFNHSWKNMDSVNIK